VNYSHENGPIQEDKVHNKWHAGIAFLTAGNTSLNNIQQQMNAVYQDKFVGISPTQCWTVHISDTSLIHASLNDKQCSRKLQIAANKSHQNNADEMIKDRNKHFNVLEHPPPIPDFVPHHFHLPLISLHTTFLQTTA
jgi:hypothetical protein